MSNTTNTPNAAQLQIGQSSVIAGFSNASISGKFVEIGCVPNAAITLVRKGPGNGAFYFTINSHAFAFRKEEAAQILLKY